MFTWHNIVLVKVQLPVLHDVTKIQTPLQNYWPSWEFTFMMYKNCWKLLFPQIFDFVGWVIETSWLIYFRSVKFHYVKETHMMLVA